MTQTYKVQVSMNQAHIVESGFVWKQGDFGFNIEIEVLDFDTTGATPQIIFRKSTGAVEATQISVAGNKFTYAIRGTELDTPGPCVCDLKLKDSTTKRVSTASFKYFVIPDTMDGLEQEASSYSDTIERVLEETISELSEIVIDNSNKGIVLTNTISEHRVESKFIQNEKVIIKFTHFSASVSGGAAAIAFYEIINGEAQTANPLLVVYNTTLIEGAEYPIVFSRNIDGILVRGPIRGGGTTINNFEVKISILPEYDTGFITDIDTINGNISDINTALGSLDERLDSAEDKIDSLYLEDVENITFDASTSSTSGYSYNHYAVVNHPIEKDCIVRSITFKIPTSAVNKIESIDLVVGVLDQRDWFLPRKKLDSSHYSADSLTGYVTIDLTEQCEIAYKGETFACNMSVPNAVGSANVWFVAVKDSNTYDHNYEWIDFTDLNATGTHKEKNPFYFSIDTAGISEVYATNERVDKISNNVDSINDALSKSGILVDQQTGDIYKLVVNNGTLSLKSLNFRKIFSYGHSFTTYSNADNIGWYRDSGDYTALCPSIRDRDFLGILASTLNATVTKRSGVNFERNYSTSYDFSANTELGDLDNTYDCVIVYLGENAAYNNTMKDSWVHLINSIKTRSPLAEIFVSSSWVTGDKKTAIETAALECGVNIVDVLSIKDTTQNHSVAWTGGEYYIGKENSYYPLYNSVSSHPNDYGFYKIAEKFLIAMNREISLALHDITLNQTNGGTISTPCTEWPVNGVVTIITEPNNGKIANGITVQASGVSISTVMRENTIHDGTLKRYYTFIMPDSDVDVTATWIDS